MSTTAQSNSSSYGIGYADAADPGNPAGLASGQIEIEYTLLGDANLGDARGQRHNFAILATNFNKAVSGWDAGDLVITMAANGSDFWPPTRFQLQQGRESGGSLERRCVNS